MTCPAPTIMVIDDNKVDRMVYERVINRVGLFGQTISFAYAEDALAHLRTTGGHVDLILLDINMPRMDGFEFLASAQDTFGDAFSAYVVIMLTTSLNPDDRDKALAFSVVRDFLNKPLTTEMLQDLAARFLPEITGPAARVL